MISVAFINSNGEVQNIMSPGSDSDYIDGQVYGDYIAKLIDPELDWGEVMTRYVFIEGTWVIRPEKPGPFYIGDGPTWRVNTELLQGSIKSMKRNRLIASDWTQLGDVPLTNQEKQLWIQYRQAVRDISDIIPAGVDNLDYITWPTPPT